MLTAFLLEVTAVVACLVLACTGLSHLPPTGWLLNVTPGDHQWNAAYVGLLIGSLTFGYWFLRRAIARPLSLGTIPGVSARTSGAAAFLLAIPSALTLFWWIAARSANRLPVGPVGYALGLIALVSFTWFAVAAGALWSGRESQRERDVAESGVGEPIGLP
jgi:hypothetical protein